MKVQLLHKGFCLASYLSWSGCQEEGENERPSRQLEDTYHYQQEARTRNLLSMSNLAMRTHTLTQQHSLARTHV